jgi:hypothetical protein
VIVALPVMPLDVSLTVSVVLSGNNKGNFPGESVVKVVSHRLILLRVRFACSRITNEGLSLSRSTAGIASWPSGPSSARRANAARQASVFNA